MWRSSSCSLIATRDGDSALIQSAQKQIEVECDLPELPPVTEPELRALEYFLQAEIASIFALVTAERSDICVNEERALQPHAGPSTHSGPSAPRRT